MPVPEFHQRFQQQVRGAVRSINRCSTGGFAASCREAARIKDVWMAPPHEEERRARASNVFGFDFGRSSREDAARRRQGPFAGRGQWVPPWMWDQTAPPPAQPRVSPPTGGPTVLETQSPAPFPYVDMGLAPPSALVGLDPLVIEPINPYDYVKPFGWWEAGSGGTVGTVGSRTAWDCTNVQFRALCSVANMEVIRADARAIQAVDLEQLLDTIRVPSAGGIQYAPLVREMFRRGFGIRCFEPPCIDDFYGCIPEPCEADGECLNASADDEREDGGGLELSFCAPYWELAEAEQGSVSAGFAALMAEVRRSIFLHEMVHLVDFLNFDGFTRTESRWFHAGEWDGTGTYTRRLDVVPITYIFDDGSDSGVSVSEYSASFVQARYLGLNGCAAHAFAEAYIQMRSAGTRGGVFDDGARDPRMAAFVGFIRALANCTGQQFATLLNDGLFLPGELLAGLGQGPALLAARLMAFGPRWG